MEDITQKMDELITSLSVNSVPQWVTYIGIFVPIMISILVVVITIIQHRRSKKLQQDICDKEMRVQMHNDFLAIYDEFVKVFKVILGAQNGIEKIFVSPQNALRWFNDFRDCGQSVWQALNKAELLCPETDTEFVEALRNIHNKTAKLFDDAWNYYYSYNGTNHYNATFGKISALYKIQSPDQLYFNLSAYQDFLNMYIDDNIKEINKSIETIITLMSKDRFDVYFEPYVKMQ